MSSEEPISRNAPCPCGSGKKYKRCCGAIVQVSETVSNAGPIVPSAAERMYADAMALRDAGRIADARKKYEEILKAWPNETQAISGLGYCLIRLGQRERGLAEAKRAVELVPSDPIPIMELSLMFYNLGEVEDALEWATRAVALGPVGADANTIIANCHERTHRIREALEANRLAQAANPQNTWLKLQEAKLVARDGDDSRALDILRETTGMPGLPPELKAQAFSEMGRALDKLGKYDQAYESFVQSGLESSRTTKARRFKLEHRPSIIASYMSGLTAERLSRWRPEDLEDDSWTPVFLVGFPRSGTTMTEQILAAHSGIESLGERPYLDNLRLEWAQIVGAKPDLGQMVDQLDADIILRLRKMYREKVEADQKVPRGAQVIIDKVPLNIMNIGFINLVFPDAKIIVALRDPRDSCLSCFMQEFELNSAMIHFLSLERAVRFYTQVMGSWLHFRQLITLPFVTVRYEDTVRDIEAQAKRLIDFLGLDWEPGVLQFHQRAAEQVISTPSYVAVTEPVHSRAIGRWKNYAEPFAPLLPSLEPFVREFGYETG